MNDLIRLIQYCFPATRWSCIFHLFQNPESVTLETKLAYCIPHKKVTLDVWNHEIQAVESQGDEVPISWRKVSTHKGVKFSKVTDAGRKLPRNLLVRVQRDL